MGYGTSQMTPTTHTKFLPEIWGSYIEVRDQEEVMAKLVERKDADVKNGGTKINFPLVSALTTTAVSDNTAVTFQATTESEVELSLNRHYESSFMLQDRTKIQSSYELAKIYGKRIAQALIEKYETDLTGLYSGLTQTVGTGHTSLTEALLVRAIQYLDDAKAPQTERYFVCKPAAMNNLRQISRFTEYQNTNDGKAPMVGGQRGFVTNVFGVDVYVTTNIAQVAGTPGIIHNLLFHRSAFALAMQKDISVEDDRRPDYLGTGYVASALWGYCEMRDDHAVDVRTVMQS